MTGGGNKAGILLMIATTFVFSVQDGISRHLAGEYNVFMVVMIRYWFFAAFVMALAARTEGGLRAAATTGQPGLQIARGLILAVEILMNVTAFVVLGLVEAHAVFATYPLMIAALAGPILGEKAGWRRWLAIFAGFVGMLIVLRPGTGVFSVNSFLPFVAALLFAIYGLLTRYAARRDSASTSFFWTGTVGAVFMTVIGVWFWEPMTSSDWLWMAGLCLTGAGGHWLLIKCYAVAEAGAVQPFAYFQLVFAGTIGVTVFGDLLETPVVVGGAIIVAAGVFTLLRERAVKMTAHSE